MFLLHVFVDTPEFTNLLCLKLNCFAPERMGADFIWSPKGKQEHGCPGLCLWSTLSQNAEITHFFLGSNTPTCSGLTQIPQALPLGVSLMYFEPINAIKYLCEEFIHLKMKVPFRVPSQFSFFFYIF